jgi:ectoine hydroxylase-related dioxygenase (phytanoyl-CoA dioxygenase family)
MKKESEKSYVSAIRRDDVLDDNSLTHLNKLIKEEGAVVIKNIFSNDLVKELKKGLEDCIEVDEKKFGKDYVFYGMVHALMTREKIFRKALEDDLVMLLMRELLGHGAIVHAFNSSSIPPFGSVFSGALHVDSPRVIPGYITNMVLTIALNDFTEVNGAMEIWPKSFNLIDKPSIEDFNKNKIILKNIKAGDAVFFNSRCWHKGGVNETNDWRHAIAVTGSRSYMKQQFDFPKMFDSIIEDGFSENFKQFMGYYVRIPINMNEFLLPSSSRLYKSGQE